MTSLPAGYNGPVSWSPFFAQNGGANDGIVFDGAWSAQVIDGWCHCTFVGAALAAGSSGELYAYTPLAAAASVQAAGSWAFTPVSGSPETGVAEAYDHDGIIGEVFFRRSDGTYFDVAIAADDSFTFQVIYPVGDGVAFSGLTTGPNEAIFEYNGTTGDNGSAQTWEVPSGVTSVTIECWGAQGNTHVAHVGGPGAYIAATITVTPGETLEVYVGGRNTGTGIPGDGGYNGGGDGGAFVSGFQGAGGGGASDVRRTPYALADRLIVAGGGGGGGATNGPDRGGQGGSGGATGGTDGGGTNPGGGASTSAGGTASSDTACTPVAATNGALGQGGQGTGGTGCIGITNRGGGGGGGGLYGGGGGGRDSGGGGGSSGTTGTLITATTGARFGQGRVRIVWT